MIDREDVRNAMRHIQGEDEAQKMARIITDALCDIPGIGALPKPMYRRISEVVAEFYALGYVQGMSHRP